MIHAGFATSNFFLPTRISVTAWFAANRSAVTLGGSNEVSVMYDLSGNGHHVVQPTGSEQPIWTENRINGLPTLVCDGSSALNANAILLDSMSVCLVAKSSSLPHTDNYVFGEQTVGETEATNSQYQMEQLDSEKIQFGWEYGAGTNYNYLSTLLLGTTQTYYVEWRRDNTAKAINLYAKNSLIESGEGTTYSNNNSGGSSTNFCICGLHDGRSDGLVGDLGEIAFFSKVLSTNEQTWMRSYLMTRWGI